MPPVKPRPPEETETEEQPIARGKASPAPLPKARKTVDGKTMETPQGAPLVRGKLRWFDGLGLPGFDAMFPRQIVRKETEMVNAKTKKSGSFLDGMFGDDER
jgi:hypothetical protein